MSARYDTIGVDYANLRKPDSRIGAAIRNALGDAQSVLNVGAGTGSYEPDHLDVMALEPSGEMIAQRSETSAPVIQGVAENLPFGDNTFDAAMGVLTIHHWADAAKGLSEMARVSRGPLVLLTYDATVRDFWLLDYFPELATLDDDRMPPMELYSDVWGEAEVRAVPIPADCTDGFLAAYWRRPEMYLDPRLRAAMSSFWMIEDVEIGVSRLSSDLESGAWDAKYGYLRDQVELDCGYRLVVASA